MAASPFRIRELRYLSGTSLNTTYTAASDASWAAGTATKLRCQSIDLSGLVYNAEDDGTLESQLYRARAMIPTLRNGSLKFSMYLEGAESDATANPLATLLGHIIGNVQVPQNSARSETYVDAGASTTTVLNMTGIDSDVSAGQAVLLGARGDSLGEGEVRVVASTSSNNATLSMATANIVTGGTIVYSTTVYARDITQQLLDFLIIGSSAEDQYQTLGCMGPFSFSGLNPGEVPMVEFDLQVADWQHVPTADRDQLEPTSAASGNQPAVNRGVGGCFIGNAGSAQARATYKIADLSINPGVTFEPIPDPNGINGIGGWQRVPSAPTAEFTVILEGNADPLPGFYDDFVNGSTSTGMQAKQVLFQFGHTAQRCVAVDFENAYFDSAMELVDVGGLTGVRCKIHGSTPAYADSAANALDNSAMRIHFF